MNMFKSSTQMINDQEISLEDYIKSAPFDLFQTHSNYTSHKDLLDLMPDADLIFRSEDDNLMMKFVGNNGFEWSWIMLPKNDPYNSYIRSILTFIYEKYISITFNPESAPKVICYPRKTLKELLEKKELVRNSSTAFILIWEYGYQSTVEPFKDLGNSINVYFQDKTLTDSDTSGIISEYTASRIVEFIEEHLGSDFIVCCKAGLSRSQGVVRYILDTYPKIYFEENTNPDNPCNTPNYFVTSILKRKERENR